MFISFKSPKVIGLGLASMAVAFSIEAIDDRRPLTNEAEKPVLTHYNSSSSEHSGAVPSAASWVALNTNQESAQIGRSTSEGNNRGSHVSQVSTVRELEYCLISMAQLSTEKSPMYVRSGPQSKAAIVGELETGRWIGIVGATEQWFQIIDPTKGWVERADVDNGCNEKAERLNLSPRQRKVTIEDSMVGISVHRYMVHIPPGKSLILTNMEGNLPKAIAPNGDIVTDFWQKTEEDLPKWIGQPLESGDYTLEIISHDYRLNYSFSLEVSSTQEYAQILKR